MLKATLAGFALVVATASLAVADEDPLIELGQRYEAQFEKARQARESATTDDKAIAVFLEHDPRNVFVDELLPIEQAHRGTPVAISALYRLVDNATTVSDPDCPASQGRLKAIAVLREHYREHPDLDLFAFEFEGGAFVPEAEGLLRDATSSPHAHVRAAARYTLARFLCLKADLAERFGPGSKHTETPSDRHSVWQEMQKKLRERLKTLAINPSEERKKALRSIDDLIAQDSEVRQFVVRFDGPGNLHLHRSEPSGDPQPTYASKAEAIRFELENLQTGQTAPDISGEDADGLTFRLSDYRGRVVLLFFSANWCGPCKEKYPDLRKLQADLQDEPFAILAVMGDQDHATVIEDTKSGEIRWRTLYDGNDGPIATRWNILAWPTLRLLDHRGVIVERDVSGDSYATLKKRIDPLLAAQRADPQAQEQIKANPLPDLPSLKRDE